MEFPVYTSGNIYEYMESVKKFRSGANKEKYDMVFDFVQKWLGCSMIEIKSLLDFKYVNNRKLPKNDHCRQVLKKYATKTSEKLKLDYKYDKKAIKKHYKLVKKKREKDKKPRKHNPANDCDNPFRSEMFHFIRLILGTIEYKLYSETSGRRIIWRIVKNAQCKAHEKYTEIKINYDDNNDEKESSIDDDSEGDDANDTNEDNDDKNITNNKKINSNEGKCDNNDIDINEDNEVSFTYEF
jgi:hypothetical protein